MQVTTRAPGGATHKAEHTKKVLTVQLWRSIQIQAQGDTSCALTTLVPCLRCFLPAERVQGMQHKGRMYTDPYCYPDCAVAVQHEQKARTKVVLQAAGNLQPVQLQMMGNAKQRSGKTQARKWSCRQGHSHAGKVERETPRYHYHTRKTSCHLTKHGGCAVWAVPKISTHTLHQSCLRVKQHAEGHASKYTFTLKGQA